MRSYFTEAEHRAWSLLVRGRSLRHVAGRLGISESRARHDAYGAAAVAIQRWQRRQSRGFLKRIFRKGTR